MARVTKAQKEKTELEMMREQMAIMAASADHNTICHAVWVWDGARDGFTGNGHAFPERRNTSLNAIWVANAARGGFTSSAGANGDPNCHGAEA
ncbi:hypothetical protein OQA88_1043 [Cercophora sp. LCS_1]